MAVHILNSKLLVSGKDGSAGNCVYLRMMNLSQSEYLRARPVQEVINLQLHPPLQEHTKDSLSQAFQQSVYGISAFPMLQRQPKWNSFLQFGTYSCQVTLLLAPQLCLKLLTWIVQVAQSNNLMPFIDAGAQIIDGIFSARDQSQYLQSLLHKEQINIIMDSDEERDSPTFHSASKLMMGSFHISTVSPEITIAIVGRQSRGSGLKKHTAYLIKGQDKNGIFQVWRRFNQLFELRMAMVREWPGCLIPSLPSKNPFLKNQEQINKKRERYLSDFLKKVALRPFLYYSTEFQSLLRSQQSNLSDTFSKWPTPTTEVIIAKYKQNFGVLSGREINHNTVEQIFDFHQWLDENQKTLIEYRKVAKQMAFQRDRQNKYYLQFFKIAKQYEETFMANYTEPWKLVYINPELKQSCMQHEARMAKIVQSNPYWLLYDLIKNEQRDGRAFSELISSIQHYGDKIQEAEIKIETNVKGISETTAGKKTIKTIGMKGTADEIKYQLQVQNEGLKKQKELSQTLRDIIIALVCYIEIKEYKASKKLFYEYTMNKLMIYQDSFADSAIKIWEQLQTSIEKIIQKGL